MKQSEKEKRKYIIIGLCAVLMIMVVGYAAFAQQLKINGTSEITTSWNIRITNISTIIPSGSGAGDVNSTCDESGTPKQCGDGLTASVSATLVSPGDSITYRIKLENKGSLNAVLSGITLNANQSNDIGFYINKDKNNSTISDTGYRLLEENGVLNPTGDSDDLDAGYVYLTVYYKDYEGQTSPTGNNKTVSVTAQFNFAQSNNAATPPAPASSFVYAYHTDFREIGTSTVTDGVSDYTQLSSYQNGKNYFLKYELDGSNVIQNAWACMKFSFISEPVCLQGGNASYYTANRGIIEGLANTFEENEGECSADDYGGFCAVGDLEVNADSGGDGNAGGGQAREYCGVGLDGYALCV